MAPDSNRHGRDFRAAIRAARASREGLFGPFGRETTTNAYRLINAEGDAVAGFVADAYAGFVVVQVLEPGKVRDAEALEDAIAEAFEPRGVVRKLRFTRTSRDRGRVEDELTRGEEPPQRLIVRSNGVPFEVELRGGFHVGLFTDMREEHARMRSLARGRRVLNTFAYTGAFSVAAALGGAVEVTSVDVVGKVLERARRNFELSEIDPGKHRFARMEVLELLRMAKRRAWAYDAIVLDPPTYATFKSGSWSALKSYPDLLGRALDVLAPDGLLWAAANTEGIPPDRFEAMLELALEQSGRAVRTLAVGGLPADYPTPATRPAARYLKVHVLRVS
jgi:23S rRNA (cytosine1962-C5)-methyltransferase